MMRIRSRGSRRTLLTHLSTIAFIRGACEAVSTTRMPSALNTSSNIPVNLPSLSLIKKGSRRRDRPDQISGCRLAEPPRRSSGSLSRVAGIFAGQRTWHRNPWSTVIWRRRMLGVSAPLRLPGGRS